jgi:hypothetical protein
LPCLLTFFMGLFVSVESGLIAGTLCHSLILVFFSSRNRILRLVVTKLLTI